jgi:hypothetical protein
MALTHITTTTAHTARTPRTDCAPATIDHLLPLVWERRGWVPGRPDLYLTLLGPVDNGACVWQVGPEPGNLVYVIGVLCVVESESLAAWSRAHQVAAIGAHNVLLQAPPPTPWLTSTPMTWPPAHGDLPEVAADLSRCLAWAVADHIGAHQ